MSPIIISAHFDGIVTFKPSSIIEDVEDAYPSIDGAVAKIICATDEVRERILPMSFITPEPTEITPSQLWSKCIMVLPTDRSSGSMVFEEKTYLQNGMSFFESSRHTYSPATANVFYLPK